MQSSAFHINDIYPDEDEKLTKNEEEMSLASESVSRQTQQEFSSNTIRLNLQISKKSLKRLFAILIILAVIGLAVFIYSDFIQEKDGVKISNQPSLTSIPKPDLQNTQFSAQISSKNNHNQKIDAPPLKIQNSISKVQQQDQNEQKEQKEQVTEKQQKTQKEEAKELLKQAEIDNDQFQLSFVETQFEGKETQQILAAAAITQMENQLNKLNLDEEANLQEFMERKKLLEDISTLQIMIPDKPLPDYVASNFYFFSVSIHQMILNSKLNKMYRRGQTIFKISMKQHMRAIIRTQLVHNIKFNQQISVKLSPFDKSLEEKKKAIEQIMQDEQIYYESLYQLSKYNKYPLRFCLVVPSYKNVKSQLYLRNLDSIFMQDYQNYHVVYIDDASPDNTGQFVLKYIEEKGIPKDKIQVIINEINRKALYNIYNGIHSYCPDGEIVGLIDGDDSLLGRKVLQLYNAIYQSKRTAIVYSNFLKILTNNQTSFGFGNEISKSDFVAGKLRNQINLVGTHFMTFFSDLFKKIIKDDLCYDNGTFYDYAYDRAIITPMIEMAYPRVAYLPEITYEYRNDTGINDGTEDWERVSKIILEQQPYEMLRQFPFLDEFLIQKEKKVQKENKKGKNLKTKEQNGKVQLPKNYFKDDEEQQD